MNNKIGLVTMCRKAGKLVMGMDMVQYRQSLCSVCGNGFFT